MVCARRGRRHQRPFDWELDLFTRRVFSVMATGATNLTVKLSVTDAMPAPTPRNVVVPPLVHAGAVVVPNGMTEATPTVLPVPPCAIGKAAARCVTVT